MLYLIDESPSKIVAWKLNFFAKYLLSVGCDLLFSVNHVVDHKLKGLLVF